MEVDDVQTTHSSRKLPRFSDEENGELAGKTDNKNNNGFRCNKEGDSTSNRLSSGWNHPSSRIVRVSRASGGKDRHSKVLTSKGLRDRRIRLSVGTAIQFYDLQDRLGLDQPSKAVEWLLQAAADAIADLPLINTMDNIPDEKMESNGGDDEEHGFGFGSDLEGQNQNQTLSLSKSGCSSTSETSKNSSALSLSRSEIRGKARERARQRTAKDKEKEKGNDAVAAAAIDHQQNSFTQLLTGGSGSGAASSHPSRQWTGGSVSSSMEFFSPVQLIPPQSRATGGDGNQGYNGPFNMGHSSLSHIVNPSFTISGDGGLHHHHHQEPIHGQNFSFVPPESLIQTAGPAAAGVGDYVNTLSFSISSPAAGGGIIAGYSRGTLQSNSPSLFLNNNIQRFPSSSSSSSSSPMDSQSLPFFMATPPLENHHQQQHQFPAGYDGRLHLQYGEEGRGSEHKGKGKG